MKSSHISESYLYYFCYLSQHTLSFNINNKSILLLVEEEASHRGYHLTVDPCFGRFEEDDPVNVW